MICIILFYPQDFLLLLIIFWSFQRMLWLGKCDSKKNHYYCFCCTNNIFNSICSNPSACDHASTLPLWGPSGSTGNGCGTMASSTRGFGGASTGSPPHAREDQVCKKKPDVVTFECKNGQCAKVVSASMALFMWRGRPSIGESSRWRRCLLL